MRLLGRSSQCDLLLELQAESRTDDKDRLYFVNVVRCLGCPLLSLDASLSARFVRWDDLLLHLTSHAQVGHRLPLDAIKQIKRVAEKPLEEKSVYPQY